MSTQPPNEQPKFQFGQDPTPQAEPTAFLDPTAAPQQSNPSQYPTAQYSTPNYTAPGTTAPGTPAPGTPAPNYTAPSASDPNYAGTQYAAAPSYGAPSSYTDPAYGNPAYPNMAGAAPAYGYMQQQPPAQRNIVGIIALVLAILGTVLSCIPGVVFLGWFLLPIAFILGIVAALLSNKKKLTGILAIIISIAGTFIAAIAFFVFIADAVNDAVNGELDSNLSDVLAGSDGSSRENPHPLGTVIKSSDWEITVNSVNLDATNIVTAENPINEVPASGNVYILANVTVKYIGTDPAGAMPFITVGYVTPAGNAINSYDSFTMAPDALDTTSQLYEGASTTGNVAIQVPSQGVENGVLTVKPDFLSSTSFVAVR